MTAKTLREKTINALSWSVVDSVANRLLSLVVAIYLARMLDPHEFGIMGMLSIVVVLASLIVEGGFTSALIQKSSVTNLDMNTVFYVNASVGMLVAILLYACSPAIASFYHEPVLVDVAAAMSLMFVIDGFSAVQTAQLMRELRFMALAMVSVVSVSVSGLVAILMAKAGYGVWSLVVQQLVRVGLATLCLWFISAWRPALEFSTRSFRQMFSYGWRMLASGTLSTFFDNVYFVVIGRVYGSIDLGHYTRADMLQRIPTQSLNQIVNRVTFPVFASIQDQPERLRSGMRKALTHLVLINFPLMAGLALTAEPLVLTLLTDRWLPVVPLLQLLALVGLLYPAHSVNLSLLQATGRSDLHLRIAIIKYALVLVNVAVTWRLGITAMIIGQIALSFVAYFINARYTHGIAGYGIGRQLHDMLPCALATLAMSALVLAVAALDISSPILDLLARVAGGAVGYAAVCALFRLEAFVEAVQEIRGRLAGRMN